MNNNEYALYKGEKLLSVGTLNEIAEELGILKSTLYHYNSPAYQRRLATRKNLNNCRVLVKLDSDESEESTDDFIFQDEVSSF